MNKIFLIIQREYLTRVRKKSFIIMTILGPLLMAGLMIVPIYVSKLSDKKKEIAVIDQAGILYNRLENTESIHFTYLYSDLETVKKDFKNSGYYAILHIPEIAIFSPSSIRLFSEKQPSISVKIYLENNIRKEFQNIKLAANGIDPALLETIKKEKIEITTIKMGEDGSEERSNSDVATVLAFFGAILIYFFIFMFGSQVMRGVIEEKTSRIIEIIVSSVKPFQLMMGKIVGVAMVGLTQFLLWIILTLTIVGVVKAVFPEMFSAKNTQTMLPAANNIVPAATTTDDPVAMESSAEFNQLVQDISNINFGLMIGMFLFYFLGGYLLYSSLMAAIGAAVDNEADTQQFMLPVTVPLIFAFIMANFVINNPEGPVAYWLSIIPLTSPIIMMIRIPFGVPAIDFVVSATLLVAAFLGSTWLAGKIYRTGILMYGKKISYKELWKWLKYKS